MMRTPPSHREADHAVLASHGHTEAAVYRRPRVAVASTGDELLPPGEALRPGKIYNSNLFLIAARLKELGLDPVVLGILPDDVEEAAREIAAHAEGIDLFLTTGASPSARRTSCTVSCR